MLGNSGNRGVFNDRVYDDVRETNDDRARDDFRETNDRDDCCPPGRDCDDELKRNKRKIPKRLTISHDRYDVFKPSKPKTV